MVEEVDDHRRGVKGPLHAVVVPDILQPGVFRIGTQSGVQRLPVQTAAAGVNLFV